MKKINHRKIDHIRICLEEDVESGDTGFARISLSPKSLPEIDYDEISLKTKFLGKKLDYPFIIEALTGGTREAGKINRELACVAEKLNIGFGVGSQRAAIDDSEYEDSFKVRDVAPDILLIANIGAVQLNYGYGVSECRKAVDMIGADALALHVNPLQEVMQDEGNKNFTGLTAKINEVAKKLKTPVILKEVGCGINRETAEKLKVSAFDVGGLGGTNWALVEGIRAGRKKTGQVFSEWGIPTTESIRQIAPLGKPVIASGGIRTGLDAAKAIALGASCAGMALPVLRVFSKVGAAGVEEYLLRVVDELRIACFLSGAKNPSELSGRALFSLNG